MGLLTNMQAQLKIAMLLPNWYGWFLARNVALSWITTAYRLRIFARMPVVNAIGETFYIALGGLVIFFALSVTIIETGHASTGAICCAFRDRAERNQKCNNRAKHYQRTILVAISCDIPRVCHDDLLNQNDPT